METENKTFFYHGTTIDNARFTIAGQFEDENLTLGIAICGKHDRFVKKLGRAKAEGRLSSNSTTGKCFYNKGEKEERIYSFIEVCKTFNTYSHKHLVREFQLW